MNVKMISSYPEKEDGVAQYTRFLVEELGKTIKVNTVCLYKKTDLPVIKEVYAPLLGINALNKLITTKPDLVHIQFTTALYPKTLMLFLTGFLKKQIGVPVVLTQHEVLIEKRKIKVRTWYERFIYDLADKIIVHTGYACFGLQLKGVQPNKIVVLPHGVKKFLPIGKHQARKTLRIEDYDPVLLVFGFLPSYKGVEYGLKALSIIIKNYPNILLLVVGAANPQLRNKYIQITKNLGLEKHVIFAGYIKNELIDYYFRSADLVLLPYLSDITQSGVLHLAIGASVPVVASAVRGMELVKQQEIGILVPPKDEKSIAYATNQILKDKDFYNRCKEVCTKLAKEWSWEEVAKMHLQLYETLRLSD